MPAKKLSIFQDEHLVKTDTKKPTLLQWLKEQPKDANSSRHIVRVIWLPGKWDNYTLETEAFRVTVKPGSPLYDSLRDSVDALFSGTSGVELSVNPSNPGVFGLYEIKQTGKWRAIGHVGIAFDLRENGDS